MTTALAVAASLVALAFAGSTYERWLIRRAPQHLAWTVALALFVVGAASLAWGSAAGWSSLTFRIFYATGAIANVPVLALGQLYLLLPRRTVDRIARVLSPLLALVCGVTLADPLRAPVPPDRLPQGSDVFGPWPRVFAAVASGLGATVLVAGTVLGIIGIARARRRTNLLGASRRIMGLALLAAGTVVLSLSGLLNSVLDEMAGFSVTLMVGITILFGGFLLSTGGPVRSDRDAASSR